MPITPPCSRPPSRSRFGPAPRRSRLTSSTGSAVFGQPITFVANVTAAVPPGGTVTFFDNGSRAGHPRSRWLSHRDPEHICPGDRLPFHHRDLQRRRQFHWLALRIRQSASVGQSASKVVLVPHPALKKKRVASEVLTAEIQPTSPGGGVPTGMVSFELLTKKRKKIQTKDLGTASVSGGEATLTVKPKKVLGKSDHDRLQRRHEFHGQYFDRAQVVEEGTALELVGDVPHKRHAVRTDRDQSPAVWQKGSAPLPR